MSSVITVSELINELAVEGGILGSFRGFTGHCECRAKIICIVCISRSSLTLAVFLKMWHTWNIANKTSFLVDGKFSVLFLYVHRLESTVVACFSDRSFP